MKMQLSWILAFCFLVVALVPGAAHAQDDAHNGQSQVAPAGPSLDFTLNYINSSIDGSITVNGATLTITTGKRPYPFETGSVDVAEYKVSTSGSGDEKEGEICIVCPRNVNVCIDHFQQYNKKDTDQTPRENVCLGVKGNQFKSQDVARAFNHLFALMRTEHNDQLQQEQQQNQSDPFASPQ